MGTIFVAYRQPYNSPVAGRIYDRLTDRFGRELLGRDQILRSDAIEGTGALRNSRLRDAMQQCQVVVVILAPYWGDSEEPAGTSLLQDPDDPIRIAIEVALQRRSHLLPILVNGFLMPTDDTLPESIADLAGKNALELDTGRRFDDDMYRILDALGTLVKFQYDIDTPLALARTLRGNGWAPRPTRTGDIVREDTGAYFLLLLEALILAIGLTIFSGIYFEAVAQGCVVGIVTIVFFAVLLSLPEWRMISSILCALVWALLGYLLGSNIANQIRSAHPTSSLVGLAPYLGAGIVFLLVAAINYSLYRRSSVYKRWVPATPSAKPDEHKNASSHQ